MPCKKCHNPNLPPPSRVGAGATARPCWICGEQNYTFPPGMQQRKDGDEVEERSCIDCGEPFEVLGSSKRILCYSCRTRRRSRAQVMRYELDKSKGISPRFGPPLGYGRNVK